MTKALLTLILCGTICLTGCYSISCSKEPGPNQHIFVSNYGWYLFNVIPLATGNMEKYPVAPFSLFRNNVTMDKLQQALFDEAQRRNRKVDNLVWSNYDTMLFDIPGFSINLPIPYIITYHEMQLSGELK